MDVLEQAYKLKSRKPLITISRPFPDRNCCVSADNGWECSSSLTNSWIAISIAATSSWSRWIVESISIVISGDQLEDNVRSELRAKFEAKKKEWLAWEKRSIRMPGLFKVKCESSRMIALCSKCYTMLTDEIAKNNNSFIFLVRWSVLMNLKICFRPLVLLQIISFETIFTV